MRLVDLNPRGVLDADIVVGGQVIHDEHRDGMGLSFECPHCVTTGAAYRQRLAIFYANPIDGKPASDDGGPLWHREGDTYETLTLSPSIDASAAGHWHGYITNGAIT